MAKRGRIVRDPTAGPGLVIVQGRQHSFGLEGVWRSDALPRPGVVVDVEFDEGGRVTAMKAVSEARLAREQAEAVIAAAAAQGARLSARVGPLELAALGLVAFSWFWLAALDGEAALLGPRGVTLWQVLAALQTAQPLETLRDAPAAHAGILCLGALACLTGPLLACAWNDRRAHLAALLPLAFMLAVAAPLFDLARLSGVGGEPVSLGAGAYVSVLGGLYLAAAGLKRFLVAAARDEAVFNENE